MATEMDEQTGGSDEVWAWWGLSTSRDGVGCMQRT